MVSNRVASLMLLLMVSMAMSWIVFMVFLLQLDGGVAAVKLREDRKRLTQMTVLAVSASGLENIEKVEA